MPDRRVFAAVFTGGGLGTAARAGLAHAWPAAGVSWPWATFVVNAVAAALLGGLAARLPLTGLRRPLLSAGFCGGLSTFSTMQVELFEMLEAHRYLLALGYAAASITVGYAALGLSAAALGRRPRPA